MAAISPRTCTTTDEARQEIDRIDRKILELVQERHLFGERIADIRGGVLPENIPELFLTFMKDRRAWGAEIGVEGEFIDRLFSVIAQRFYDRRVQDASGRARSVR